MNNYPNSFTDYCRKLNIKTIYPRTVFYPLSPIGIGTPYAESLTSYISRIAYTHNVGNSDIVFYALSVLSDETIKLSNFTGLSCSINGMLTWTEQVVKGLERLTLRNDLKYMTLLPWKEFVSTGALRRKNKAWCPYCFYESLRRNEEMYEPLIWHFKDVEICYLHNIQLFEECHHCSKKLLTLYKMSLPGICPFCNFTLAIDPLSENHLTTIVDEGILPRQRLIISNIAELISSSNKLRDDEIANSIPRFINRIVEEKFDNNLAEFARYIGRAPHRFWSWRKNETKPELDGLLWLAAAFNTTILTLITRKEEKLREFNPQANQLFKKRRARPFNYEKVEQILINALTEDPPPTLIDLSRRTGYHSNMIRKNLPDLTRQISERRREFGNSKK